jgi:hypothetical protein
MGTFLRNLPISTPAIPHSLCFSQIACVSVTPQVSNMFLAEVIALAAVTDISGRFASQRQRNVTLALRRVQDTGSLGAGVLTAL